MEKTPNQHFSYGPGREGSAVRVSTQSSAATTRVYPSLLDDPATDPALGAAIFEMRARWPELGRDADHPLADYFAHRAKAGIPFGALMILMALSMGLSESWQFYDWFFAAFPMYLLSVIGNLVIYNTDQDRHLRLTPFPLRQMAAVQAAVALAGYRSRRSQLLRRAFQLVFWTALIIKLALLLHELKPRPPALFAVAGLIALLAVMMQSYTDVRRTLVATISRYCYSPTISVPIRLLTALLLVAVAAVGGASFSLRYRVSLLPDHARNAFLLLGMLSFAAALSFHSDMRRDFVTPWYQRRLRSFDKVEAKRRVD